MPTRDELVQMYAERYSIGGFLNAGYSTSNNYYWSSTTSSSGHHYSVWFYNGAIYSDSDSGEANRVRPIKKKTN